MWLLIHIGILPRKKTWKINIEQFQDDYNNDTRCIMSANYVIRLVFAIGKYVVARSSTPPSERKKEHSMPIKPKWIPSKRMFFHESIIGYATDGNMLRTFVDRKQTTIMKRR